MSLPLLVVACVTGTPPATEVDTLPSSEGGADSGSTWLVDTETCNGVDDDGDFRVDEVGDVDRDGRQDCTDDTCTVTGEALSPHSVGCSSPGWQPGADPWQAETLWQRTDGFACVGGLLAGDILEELPGVELACSTDRGSLVLLSGRDGATLREEEVFLPWSPLLFGAVPEPTLIGLVADERYPDRAVLAAWLPSSEEFTWVSDLAQGAASRLWVSAPPLTWIGAVEGTHPVIASPAGLVAADTGATVSEWTLRYGAAWDDLAQGGLLGFSTIAGGVDRLVAGSELVDVRGNALAWGPPPTDFTHSILLGQDDGEVPVVVTVGKEFGVLDSSGYQFLANLPTNAVMAPCAGRLLGSGMQVVVGHLGEAGASSLVVTALDQHGAVVWESDAYSDRGFNTCRVMDLDGDGLHEVLVQTEGGLQLLSGTTGASLGSLPTHSGTMRDQVILVDVDSDGSVEIILGPQAERSGDVSLIAWSHPTGGWPPGPGIWPVDAYTGVEVWPDGRVPRTSDPSWLTTKVYRGAPSSVATGLNLYPEVVEWCVSACPGHNAVAEARLAVRLVNGGPYELWDVDFPVAVYVRDEAGTRRLHGVLRTSEWLDNGAATATWEVVLTAAEAFRGVELVAGDDGTRRWEVGDCLPDDDTLWWSAEGCEGAL